VWAPEQPIMETCIGSDSMEVREDQRAHLRKIADRLNAHARLGQSQRPHEVSEIVGRCIKLKPDGVGGERAA
jgi:hypothetical protein